MNKIIIYYLLYVLIVLGCQSVTNPRNSEAVDKKAIRQLIQEMIDRGTEATRTKNIELYMSSLPPDLVIYEEDGTILSRERQKQNVLRDWSIIDTTLEISVVIDSIQYISKDSIQVYTSQSWKRMMFQRDGITTDTVLTTQRHKETWMLRQNTWYAYTIEELGGKIFINGMLYNPQ